MTYLDPAPFTIHPWLKNPHLQTVWGRLVRSRQVVPYTREILPTPDGDELILDHADAEKGDAPRILLLHGLEGSSYSVYIQSLGAAFRARGYSVTAMNFRSCARDPQKLSRPILNHRPRFYHSGETGDVGLVIDTLRRRGHQSSLQAFGASLGGNVLLKWLGENPGQQMIRRAAALSVPFDLAEGSRHLESFIGNLYVGSFLRTLKRKVTSMLQRFPEMHEQIDFRRVAAAKTFREFDDAATSRIHGFLDADDYYAKSSSIRFVHAIDTPVLAISASDDPFLPSHVLGKVRSAASAQVKFLTTEQGGHVGFLEGTHPFRCESWAERAILHWMSVDL